MRYECECEFKAKCKIKSANQKLREIRVDFDLENGCGVHYQNINGIHLHLNNFLSRCGSKPNNQSFFDKLSLSGNQAMSKQCTNI